MDILNDLILIVTYVFLGLLQGITEPLPISSSGHLVLIKEFFSVHLPGLSFEIIVHVGSLIAICTLYRKDLSRLLLHSWQFLKGNRTSSTHADFRFMIFLWIATLPAGIIGLLFGDIISDTLSTVKVVGGTLLITGAFLWIIRKKRGNKDDANITVKDAIIIGCAQAVALVPGISRSGATLIAALFLGVHRDTALRFSFLLFIPVSIGTIVFGMGDFLHDPALQRVAIPLIIAFITAMIATYFALQWFINSMKKGNVKYFAWYCFIVGTFVLLL